MLCVSFSSLQTSKERKTLHNVDILRFSEADREQKMNKNYPEFLGRRVTRHEETSYWAFADDLRFSVFTFSLFDGDEMPRKDQTETKSSNQNGKKSSWVREQPQHDRFSKWHNLTGLDQ